MFENHSNVQQTMECEDEWRRVWPVDRRRECDSPSPRAQRASWAASSPGGSTPWLCCRTLPSAGSGRRWLHQEGRKRERDFWHSPARFHRCGQCVRCGASRVHYVGSEQSTPGSGGRALCTDTSCFSAPRLYRCYRRFLWLSDTCAHNNMTDFQWTHHIKQIL